MTKKAKKVIIDIIPLTKIPLSRDQFFCYLHPEKIAAGSLVSIPFANRKIEGIVIKSRSDFPRLGNVELKKVEKVLEENFLDENQLQLAQYLSKHFISPLGIVMKSFIPKRTKERKKKIPASTRGDALSMRGWENKLVPTIVLTKEQSDAVEKISNSSKNKNFLLFGPSGSGKTEVYINAIKKLKKNEQTLVLVPELTLSPQAVQRYSEHFGEENISVLNSKISKGKYYSQWKKIQSGETKIIIGTRMSVFAPFKDLGLIVIDEEQDISFKQWEMNPRYDARTAAEKLAEIHQAKIVRGSATPLLETFQKVTDKKYQLLKLSRLKIPNANFQLQDSIIELVDMKKERWDKNYSTISKALKSEIAFSLKHKFQTIIFINRQGLSSFSICSSCKTVLKCPDCDRALVFDNSGIYKCIHCKYKSSVIPECSKCRGIAFQNIGTGTQKVEKEIRDLFPSAKISRIDNQTSKIANFQEKTYTDFQDKKIDILIGTQMISKGWDLPNVSLVGIIDGDTPLSIPDFSAYEKAFQTILQVSGRTGRPHSKIQGKTIIQTFNPEQPFFKLIADRKLEEFYKKESEERRDLSLPPFGKLIKLLFQDISIKKAEEESQRVFALLKEHESVKIAVSEPRDAYLSKLRGRFRKQIVIKLKSQKSEEITRIIQSLPGGWLVDVDPISII